MARESYWDYMGRRLKEADSKSYAMCDEEMVILLHDTARQIGYADTVAESQLRQVADRFSELIKMKKNRK